MVRVKQEPTQRAGATQKTSRRKIVSKPAADGAPKTRKPVRFRPGTVALRNVRREQRDSHKVPALKKSHMRRIFRSALASMNKSDLRIGVGTLDALREATEDFGQELYGLAQDLCSLESRQTPRERHYRFAGKLVLNGARRSAPHLDWIDGLAARAKPPTQPPPAAIATAVLVPKQ
jgi:histone H3